MAYFVYILECSDKSYYVGMTSDLKQRVAKHNAGEGAVWTIHRRPVKLVYKEQHATKIQALKRERQIKHWTRAKKEALIAGDIELLRSLSKSRSKKNERYGVI